MTRLNSPEALEHFRQEMFFPRLFARQTIDQWVNDGSKMTHEVAHKRVLEILDEAEAVELPPGADSELERALRQAVE